MNKGKQIELFDDVTADITPVDSLVITPVGCWNCQHANIDGERPTAWMPGTQYRTGCNAPQRTTPGVVGTATMTAERPDLPTCEWHELL